MCVSTFAKKKPSPESKGPPDKAQPLHRAPAPRSQRPTISRMARTQLKSRPLSWPTQLQELWMLSSPMHQSSNDERRYKPFHPNSVYDYQPSFPFPLALRAPRLCFTWAQPILLRRRGYIHGPPMLLQSQSTDRQVLVKLKNSVQQLRIQLHILRICPQQVFLSPR